MEKAPNIGMLNKESPSVKRSLILAGGGMRLAYQAGVLQALEESGLCFTHVDGTSGGIFNTAMLASGLSPAEMSERWRKLNVQHFASYRPLKEYFRINKISAFGDADGIRGKVFKSLGIDLEKIRGNRQIAATFNVCNFSNKTIESVPNEEVTEDHLIAGMSLPIFMPAIKIKEDWYSDAVWIKDANLMEAVRRGAEELWLVWAIGNNHAYLNGSFNQYVHMIEMSANGGLLEEYAQIKLINDQILRGYSPFGQKSPIRLFVIKPEFPLPLDPDLFFDKINTSTLINMGYSDAKTYLEESPIREIAFDLNSSKMREPGATLYFRQHFTGNMMFENKKTSVSYSPSFSLRNSDGKLSLNCCSSIYLPQLGREVSTKNNIAKVINQNGKKAIQVESEFESAGIIYALKATIPLSSSIDWMLALEFKEVKLHLSIQKDAKLEELLNIRLFQSIKNRFKNLFSSNLRHYNGNGFQTKEKYKMISKLYQYEV